MNNLATLSLKQGNFLITFSYSLFSDFEHDLISLRTKGALTLKRSQGQIFR